MGARIFISSVIFILLTVFKLVSPEAANGLRELVIPQMTGSGDLKAQVLALGSRITGENENPVYASESDGGDSLPVDVKAGDIDISADFSVEDMVRQNLNGLEKAESEEVSEVTKQQWEKQAEFLQVQAAFADYAVPAGVSYDVPVFAFDCVCPADASVSSPFGYRIHPTYGDVRFHYGTDYALYEGDNILAFADGKVVTVQSFSGYGLTLIIDHGDGVTTLYAHCSQILVAVGKKVTAGQTVALAGQTGRATGPHLHFEVEIDGVRYNPELCFG
ncbi:MAG: M23 family metallopeptidase [Clostridia bacterium]|nr:M23 family metallopeptidase [Clostridia bacterium]